MLRHLCPPLLIGVGLLGMLTGCGTFEDTIWQEQQRVKHKRWSTISEGLLDYNTTTLNNHFPPQHSIDAEGKPLLSWRVLILPHLRDPEAQALYAKFKLDEPWDSPANKELLEKIPKVYAPTEYDLAQKGMTKVLGVSGPGTAFVGGLPQGREVFTDTDWTPLVEAPAKTIVAVQAAPERAVPWTKPEDFPWNPDDPITGMEVDKKGRITALFARGEVLNIPHDLPTDQVNALITISGGEEANARDFGERLIPKPKDPLVSERSLKASP
ncbi:hypothetical protein Pan216_05130 [Planctomycetes bacterium Pan216]|uniref:DUF1559 domain-containing protein n=1 Tax=Kolteria novifilia TaxID=2527975 RepID=A0A518AY79_9BACT|nr:hypothetical protein Pan216_05130 [Planctomycetes bacterium Pan216]